MLSVVSEPRSSIPNLGPELVVALENTALAKLERTLYKVMIDRYDDGSWQLIFRGRLSKMLIPAN